MADAEETPNPYSDALWKAYTELQELQKTEHELTLKKARLKQTIDALYPIVFPDATRDINELTLANAIRLVINSTGRPITSKEVRSRLEDLGYDLSKFKNPLASIHTAANRMIDSEELVWVEDDDAKRLAAGPELKQVPEPSPSENMDALTAIVAAGKDKESKE